MTWTVEEVGTDWQVRIHPSATSSGVSALLTNIETSPSTMRAMHVAQLPDSHEKGGDIPICRAVCRIVVPFRCSVASVRPSSTMVTRIPLAAGRSADGADGAGGGSAG